MDSSLSAPEVRNRDWDVIVIGTGMGGATLGYALARAGKRVLFCERGRSTLTDDMVLCGDYAETFFSKAAVPAEAHREILERAGRYADVIEDRSQRRARSYIPFIGAGTGGSSALYGMALERLFPEDFQPGAKFPGARESSLPERWPISYRDLEPYYADAERLYGVRGGADPLRQAGAALMLEAPPLSAANRELSGFLAGKGLHPYRLPSACAYLPGCRSCQGFLCPRPCKIDSATACLAPALRDHGAGLLDRCQVTRLEADERRVTGVRCSLLGEDFVLRAGTVVLAAGALQTPAILLRSTSPDWPDGLANRNDQVGRNLMRHCVDLYAIATKTPAAPGEAVKQIAFNDFYVAGGHHLGSVQSFGTLPPAAMIVESLQQEVRDGAAPWLAGPFGLAKPLLKKVIGRQLVGRIILAGLMEDLPYSGNLVRPIGPAETGRVELTYQLNAHETARIAEFRRLMADILNPYPVMVMKQAENNERIAHVCGTCRFGVDPADSVLNMVNRAHEVENLYVADSSFFPSSGGTNPSLTIAANALRVADHLLGRTRPAGATES
jgi:choline dehydrogenase-like flavoprotein